MEICIRPLTDSDLQQADHIFRLAFGTFLGLSDPMTYAGEANYIKSRFHANPSGAYAAEVNGKLVGSNITPNHTSRILESGNSSKATRNNYETI
jgi:hypothetical protein